MADVQCSNVSCGATFKKRSNAKKPPLCDACKKSGAAFVDACGNEWRECKRGHHHMRASEFAGATCRVCLESSRPYQQSESAKQKRKDRLSADPSTRPARVRRVLAESLPLPATRVVPAVAVYGENCCVPNVVPLECAEHSHYLDEVGGLYFASADPEYEPSPPPGFLGKWDHGLTEMRIHLPHPLFAESNASNPCIIPHTEGRICDRLAYATCLPKPTHGSECSYAINVLQGLEPDCPEIPLRLTNKLHFVFVEDTKMDAEQAMIAIQDQTDSAMESLGTDDNLGLPFSPVTSPESLLDLNDDFSTDALQTMDGITLLIAAAALGDADCVAFLLDIGAHPCHLSKFGSAVDLAANATIRQLLVASPLYKPNFYVRVVPQPKTKAQRILAGVRSSLAHAVDLPYATGGKDRT